MNKPLNDRPTTDVRLAVSGIIVLAIVLVLSPSRLFAQGGVSGSITGIIRDTSGGILPGVSVLASSPALIEKTRDAVTDDSGRYRITDLRPGVYAVEFTLGGFTPLRREGIELSAGFTATVNGEMRVGSFEETVTVSQQAPAVDVQSVGQQNTVLREVLDAVPIGKTFINISSLTPSVNLGGQAVQDMGIGGDRSGTMQAHGSRLTESQIDVDGMPIHNGLARGGAQFGHYINDGSTQEMVIETGAMNAEHEVSGTRANVIPKEGGNTFRGTVNTSYTGGRLQDNNLDADLIARGLKSINHNIKVWDLSPNVGGRIVRDRLWFYSAFRYWGIDNTVANLYANATPASFVYTPDYSKPGEDLVWHLAVNTRLTMQPSKGNKINLFYEWQRTRVPYGYNPSSLVSPEAQNDNIHIPQNLIQATWTNLAARKWLFEAGLTVMANNPHFQLNENVPLDQTAVVDTSRNFSYRAPAGGYGMNRSNNYNGRASASYVTGSHFFKAGLFWMYEWNYVTRNYTSDMSFTFNGTRPTGITQWADPLVFRERAKNLGLFVEDQWSIRRMTLNLGLRYDHIRGWVPAQVVPAGRLVGERTFAEVDNAPLYNDIEPRLGLIYDLFGTGRTAVKASLGRYVVGIGSQIPIGRNANPLQGAVNSTSRSWQDLNADYVPDCDLTNLRANGECGQVNNLNFGSRNTVTATYDPDAITGWGHRGYNWEGTVSLQHELLTGISAGVAYTRRWYGNFFVTENTAVKPADFDPFCVTAPLNANLPGGGGKTVCGFYDVNPSKYGQNTSVIRLDNGKMQDVYDGIDVDLRIRLPHGLYVSGGTTTGRQRSDVCAYLNQPNFSPGLLVNGAGNTTSGFVGSAATIASPHQQAFCSIQPPYQTNVKFAALYPLPWWGLQTSATFQSYPGKPLDPSYQVTSAAIAPSLGRPLSAGPNSTLLVDLEPPSTLFSGRINQTNVRVEKSFPAGQGRGRLRVMIDLFNLFNQNSVLAFNTRVNATYPLPTMAEPARTLKLGAQWEF
jgi:hypothetical protein